MRVGRFAPSPTGAMHLGNARTALLAWLHSRALGGRHILRFEDLDKSRVRAFAYDVTRHDLEWLGLDWDEEYLQSERLEIYEEALQKLRTYPCTCTRKEVLATIQESGVAPHGTEVVYAGTCRPQSWLSVGGDASSKGENLKHTRPEALRWWIPQSCVQVQGCLTVQDRLVPRVLRQDLPREVGDMVLRRNDGVYAYHLAVVIDDALMQVTDVLRGVDLWAATPRQVALQGALNVPQPRYWHVPLMTDYAGKRLAKRGGAPPLSAWREAQKSSAELCSELLRSLPYPSAQTLPPEVTPTEALSWWRDMVSQYSDNYQLLDI